MRRLVLLIAALLPTASHALLPSSAAAAKKFTAPDLVIKKIVIKRLPGDPPYIAVDHSGAAPGFVVQAVTRNIGGAPAKRFRTQLEFQTLGGKPVHGMSEAVRDLAPRTNHVSVFKVDSLFPPLGLLKAVVTADPVNTVHELNEDNNTLSAGLIPVVAREWKVMDFMTTSDGGASVFPGSLESSATKALDGFIFRFSQFNETAKRFEYVPDGTLGASFDYVYAPLSCIGHGGTQVPNRQWPGYLRLEDDLTSYDALVQTNDQPVQMATITCMGQNGFPVQWTFQDLVSFAGVKMHPQMSPSDTKLTGLKTVPGLGPGMTTTYQWTFKADVPGS